VARTKGSRLRGPRKTQRRITFLKKRAQERFRKVKQSRTKGLGTQKKLRRGATLSEGKNRRGGRPAQKSLQAGDECQGGRIIEGKKKNPGPSSEAGVGRKGTKGGGVPQERPHRTGRHPDYFSGETHPYSPKKKFGEKNCDNQVEVCITRSLALVPWERGGGPGENLLQRPVGE